MANLTHFDERGASRMVDVTAKPETHRVATASGVVSMAVATLAMIRNKELSKGDVLEVARLAGIMAAKKTGDLIPLCHPLPITAAKIEFSFPAADSLRIEATVEVFGRTGVEMEALAAVSIAALTVYDMAKSVDRGMVLGEIRLEKKSGGRSGIISADRVDAKRGPTMKAMTLQTMPRKIPTRLRSAPFSLIANELDETERIFIEALEPFRSTVGPLLDHLRNYRGKRFRPALLLLAARAAGTLNDHHPILAASVEMIHTATLVHDDVLDSAETRRHKATFNANWGNAKSILFGDMLFSQAFALSSRVDRRACAKLGQTASLVCAGELRQGLEAGNLELTEEAYFEIIGGKTAELTAASAELGALYAGASDDTTAKFRDYGHHLGLAFQIADDVLDLAGEESKTGKTLGTDAAQGKLTLPIIHALRTLPRMESQELKVALRTNPRTTRQILADCGSFGYAKQIAEDHARKAREALDGLLPSEAKRTLIVMANWSIRREM